MRFTTLIRAAAVATIAATSLMGGGAQAAGALCEINNSADPSRNGSYVTEVGGPSGELHIGDMVLLPTGRYMGSEPILRDTNTGNYWVPTGTDGALALAQLNGPWTIFCINTGN